MKHHESAREELTGSTEVYSYLKIPVRKSGKVRKNSKSFQSFLVTPILWVILVHTPRLISEQAMVDTSSPDLFGDLLFRLFPKYRKGHSSSQ